MAGNLTDDQKLALNDWARTEPSLRRAFKYTSSEGVPGSSSDGLGDRLAANPPVDSEITVTDGSNTHLTDTVNFNKDDFYLSTNLKGEPVVNRIDDWIGFISGSGNASQQLHGTTWYPCPVSAAATHVLAPESSSVFTMPDNQSVFKYTGTPSIVVEITCTGMVYRGLPTYGSSVIFITFAKKNNAVPTAADVLGAGVAQVLSSVLYNEYTPFAINTVITLDTNDYVCPMFLSYLVNVTCNLSGTQTRIRFVREA